MTWQGVGSLKGIGRATAIAFARENAKALYLLDYDETNLPDLEATIRKLAPDCKVSARQGDAGDEETIEGLCNKAIEEYGRLDVFFANAGRLLCKVYLSRFESDHGTHKVSPQQTFYKISTLKIFRRFYV